MRILLVEDTPDLGEAITHRFSGDGHAVEWVRDGTAAEAMLAGERFDLLILDLMIPPPDGFEVLRRLRERGDAIPVLVLTARSEVDDRVGALDRGADDYLVKPFDFRELEARVRALLRRGAGEAAPRQRLGGLTFDPAARRVLCGDAPLDLPNREFRLLEIFLSRPGRVFSKDEIADRLFGLEDPPAPNAIEVYVARLRRRLAGSGVVIRTHRGLGYVAEADD
ncbi:response regulator transcription factor [Arhodomonas sp. AD133]|uniref:response regulator transcription factor n=1 Tax=Arhodomonas sp. AD133 TaxID=3415009 RepID=UPI003EC1104E